MVSNVDAFGMKSGDLVDAPEDLEKALQGYGGEGDEDESAGVAEKKPAGKKAPLPKSLVIGMSVAGVFAALLMIVAIVAVSSRMKQNNGRAEEAQRLAAQQQEALKASQLSASQGALQERTQSLEESVRQMREQLSKVSSGSLDLAALSARVERAEQGLALMQLQLQEARRRAADERPFEMEMFIREDATLVSIGNGIARIRMSNGDEVTVRRGDKWQGLRVTAIRADRAQVTLSDGSVIL